MLAKWRHTADNGAYVREKGKEALIGGDISRLY